MHVDHCHVTDAIRGLLCFRCNNALGDLDHDVELLESAAAYLRATAQPVAHRGVVLLVPAS